MIDSNGNKAGFALVVALAATWLGAVAVAAEPNVTGPRATAGLMTAEEPTALLLAYQAKPEQRAAFREYLETAGTTDLEHWKKQGVFTDYQILFQQLARYNDDADALVILTFPSYLATDRWVQIEKARPGGLSPQGLKLAGLKHSSFAEILAHRRVAPPADRKQEVYEVSHYEIGEKPEYRKFVAEYPVKMFDNWIGQGNIAEYTVYLALHHAGAPWKAMIVLGYRDARSYSRSAQMKIRSYADLQNDAAWKSHEGSRGVKRKKFIESFYGAIAP